MWRTYGRKGVRNEICIDLHTPEMVRADSRRKENRLKSERQDRRSKRRLSAIYIAQTQNRILYGVMCLEEIGKQNLLI
nr:MAG TPA: Protein of unknown function (DUF2971) [Caudoviricetes sp.]